MKQSKTVKTISIIYIYMCVQLCDIYIYSVEVVYTVFLYVEASLILREMLPGYLVTVRRSKRWQLIPAFQMSCL